MAQDAEFNLRGFVYDVSTGEPIPGAALEILQLDRRTRSDSAGKFLFVGVSRRTAVVRVSSFGYATIDTSFAALDGATGLEVGLQPRPFELAPLSVWSDRGQGAAERALFDREVMPGVIGITRTDIRDIPALAEADVLHSLQTLPGVVALNDLSSQLHVRGGGPDQNLFLLDDARVFAPYHVFGMFGAFNTDAVGRVDFYRGSLPARYGGSLSSVVDIEQRAADGEGIEVDGGVSLLSTRVTAAGSLARGDARWMFAGRRSDADIVMPKVSGDEFPYAFYDLQGRMSFAPAARQRVRASFFASSDRYRMFLHEAKDDLNSTWRNGLGSIRWSWTDGAAWSFSTTAWRSTYGGELRLGADQEAPETTNDVRVGGVRLESVYRGESGGLRAGVAAEGGAIDLTGGDTPGSYISGDVRSDYREVAGYLEAERWAGRFRLTPGIRIVDFGRGDGALLEPRLSGRVHFGEDVALTLGIGRTHQVISTLRDDRQVMPGAPFWIVHPDGTPVSRTDGASVALEGWHARDWSFAAEVYARAFDDIPRWRPSGSRDVAQVAFDDGDAAGFEISLRRHTGWLTGWVGYGWGRVELADEQTGNRYAPPWDQRHSINTAVFLRPSSRLSFSIQGVYGSGLPFWPFAGYVTVPRLAPFLGETRETGFTPVWAAEQERYPAYARLDVGARYRFRIRGADVQPYAGVQNVTGRANVLYYSLRTTGSPDPQQNQPILVPETAFAFTILPTIGIDVRF